MLTVNKVSEGQAEGKKSSQLFQRYATVGIKIYGMQSSTCRFKTSGNKVTYR